MRQRLWQTCAIFKEPKSGAPSMRAMALSKVLGGSSGPDSLPNSQRNGGQNGNWPWKIASSNPTQATIASNNPWGPGCKILKKTANGWPTPTVCGKNPLMAGPSGKEPLLLHAASPHKAPPLPLHQRPSWPWCTTFQDHLRLNCWTPRPIQEDSLVLRQLFPLTWPMLRLSCHPH